MSDRILHQREVTRIIQKEITKALANQPPLPIADAAILEPINEWSVTGEPADESGSSTTGIVAGGFATVFSTNVASINFALVVPKPPEANPTTGLRIRMALPEKYFPADTAFFNPSVSALGEDSIYAALGIVSGDNELVVVSKQTPIYNQTSVFTFGSLVYFINPLSDL